MNEPTHHTRPRRGLRPILLGTAFAGVFAAGGALGALGVGAAFAHPGHGGPQVMMMGPGHGMRAMDAQHMDKLLEEAGASTEQKAKIHAIMKTAFEGMKPLHGGMQQAHSQVHDLLAAPTIDRAALERVRVQHIAEADRASKTMVSAIADAAEVLTPAQRAKLAAAMAAHHAERGGDH